MPRQCVHRHVLERVAAFLTVPQQASARRASKALWEAVWATSMEDMLRATVLEHPGNNALDAQLVVVAMSRAVGPFPSFDALLAWCGGLALLYDELQLRFPHAAAIGMPARLAAIVCAVTAASAPSALLLESVVLGVRNTASILVRALSINGSPCPVLCLDEVAQEHNLNNVRDFLLSSLPSIRMVHGVLLLSIPPIRMVENCAFQQCASLQSVCLENLPLLEVIGAHAFGECVHLSRLNLVGLPSLRAIENYAFEKCESLQSFNLENLPLLESIGGNAFACCTHLSSIDFSALPSLRWIGARAFSNCVSLQSIIFSRLPSLRWIGAYAFWDCVSLPSISLSGLPLRLIKECAFGNCESLQSICLSDLSLLESIDNSAFAGCVRLSSVELSGLRSLRAVGAFVANLPLPAFSTVDLSRL